MLHLYCITCDTWGTICVHFQHYKIGTLHFNDWILYHSGISQRQVTDKDGLQIIVLNKPYGQPAIGSFLAWLASFHKMQCIS